MNEGVLAVKVRAWAPGKVNLFLAVGQVQPDGYHPVASLYAATSLREMVEVSGKDTAGIELSLGLADDSPLAAMAARGVFDPASVPLDSSNLAVAAATLLLEELGLAGLGLRMRIVKAVPVAGGMGGGSADAAAALLAVNNFVVRAGLLDQAVGAQRLLELASQLGADVPFALTGGFAVGRGVGGIVQPLDFPAGGQQLFLVLVFADYGLSTPEVFGQLDAGRAAGDFVAAADLQVPAALLEALVAPVAPVARLHELARYVRNDLAEPACRLAPDLAKVLACQAEGLVTSFVSGSGPTCVYLMESWEDAQALAEGLRGRGRYATAVTAPGMGLEVG